MFENTFRKPSVQQNPIKPMKSSSGCKIKVRRDQSGRINSIETNGLCSKQELEIFNENMNGKEEEEND